MSAIRKRGVGDLGKIKSSYCIVVLISLLAVAPSALAITLDDYKTHCSSAAGRGVLLTMLEAWERNDLEQQALANGVPVNQHLASAMEQRCAHLVPGSVVPERPQQSWSLLPENIGAPLPGETLRTLSGAADPPRCGPDCEGKFSIGPVSDDWQACRVRYVSNYHSDGPRFSYNEPTSTLEVRPDIWIDDSRFRAFAFSIKARDRSYIELRNLEFDLVRADTTKEQRRQLGCLLPARDYVERVGQNECSEDRSGIRHSDHCTVVHRAAGARRRFHHPLMRKVIISKPAGESGEEEVVTKVGIGAPKTRTIGPGQRVVLFSPPEYTDDRAVSVEITTHKVGQDGTSRYTLDSEWNKL